MILEEEKIENQKFDEGKPIAQLSTESKKDKSRLVQNQLKTKLAKFAPPFDSHMQNPEECIYAYQLVTSPEEPIKHGSYMSWN